MIPFAGLVSGGGKLISKVIKWGGNLFDWIKGASKVEKAAEAVATNITAKIQGQLARRGWTEVSINEAINNPYATRAATNKATGNPATAFYSKDGSYVVRDNVTGDVVQISKVGDANWAPDSTIVNPYKP